MHCHCTADRGAGGFGKAKVANFPGLDELRHCAYGFFDGSVWIDSVLIVKIDRIYAQTLETGITARADIFGFAIDALKAAVATAYIAKLRGNNDSISTVFNSFADQFLIVTHTIHISRVEQRHA